MIIVRGKFSRPGGLHKASGLAVVFDLTAHTFYRVGLVQVIRPAHLT